MPPEALLRCFRDLVRIRRVEEEIERRYGEDEMKTPIHLSIGQEAISVGVCSALAPSDYVFTSHRSHAPYLAKGGSLAAMIAELYGRETGCVGSRGGSMHLIDPSAGLVGGSAICGGAVPLAAGAALTIQMKKEQRLSVVFFGDGASEEGVVWETLNFAALKRLPLLFVCENNFYSVCSPLSKRQSGAQIFEKARAFGATSACVNGIDVVEIRGVADDFVRRAREGEGPFFIEARAYRWRGHGGAGEDTHLGYRDERELRQWRDHCPIEALASHLSARGMLRDDERAKIEMEIRREIEEAFSSARHAAFPQAESVTQHVYARE